MKKIILGLVALPVLAFAQQEVMLDKKVIDYGALGQETNSAASEMIAIKRGAKSPKKVTLKFTLNYMEKKCVEYETKTEEIPEFSQTVCEKALDGQHDCVDKIYSGLFNAKTVCVKEGLIRKSAAQEIKLNFGRAVTLSPTATETFQINVKQLSMSGDKIDVSGKVLDAASLYSIKPSAFGTGLKFKAK